MIDISIMAGNNEQTDGDGGDAESLVASLSVDLPLSLSGGRERFGCCLLPGLILVSGSLGWRKNSITGVNAFSSSWGDMN